MTEAAEPKGKTRKYIEMVTTTGKDVVAFLRDAILFIFAFLLLLFPVQFNSILTAAGFEEGSFAGLKWKNKVERSTEELAEAQDIIARQNQQNKSLVATLTEVQGKVNDPGLQEKVADIKESSKALSLDVVKVQSSVRQTIQTNSELLNKAVRNYDDKYVVVFGGDAKLQDAKYEAETVAPKLGIPNATIQLKQGSYRTVVIADSRSEADSLLAKVKSRRSDAYIVPLSTWCPNSTPRDGYSECDGE
jgi:hypothetical protein